MAIISPRNKKFPTPASIKLLGKVFIRFTSLLGVVIAFVPMSDMWKTITAAMISFMVGTVNDVQDWFGVEIEGNKPVPAKDVDVIKDEAIKTTLKIIIFFVLLNSYFWAELLISNF